MASPHMEDSSAAQRRMFGKAGSPNDGGSDQAKGSAGTSPHKPSSPKQCCPECGSIKLWKDGLRRTSQGPVQRYICRSCGFRFSDPRKTKARSGFNGSDASKAPQRISSMLLKTNDGLPSYRQICAAQQKGVKNLAAEPQTESQKRAAGATETADIKGKIIEFLLYLEKNGKAKTTINSYSSCLKNLIKMNGDLTNPEIIKEIIAKSSHWSERTKNMHAQVYESFIKWLGLSWERPKYQTAEKMPFIPLEEEIDQFIAAAGKKLAALLQLLKETGMRISEAKKLEWADVDFKRRLVKITPSKGSNPRILPVSEKAIGMLNNLPKKGEKIFQTSARTLESNFYLQRKKIARKLNNPRMLKISLHTFRHWKGTMEYHKTRDLLHVKTVLGHKEIKSTMIYINIENALYQNSNDEFHVKVAKTIEEAAKLIEIGFEFVHEFNGVMIFRKRK
ncbi:MAG: tyrosine-type recombinase/integrase [Candidatus Bathyarchaeia archaeon]